MLGLFLAAVGRKMVVGRRNISNGRVVVKEMGILFRERFASWQVDGVEPGTGERMKCFRRVWPETEGGGRRWWEDWEGWPLVLE
jgi:hypothetical protein